METKITNRISSILGDKILTVLKEAIPYLFLLLFVYTATDKLYTYRDFSNVLTLIPVFGPYHAITAPLIITLELLIAILLIVPSLKALGMHATFVLLIIFTLCLILMVMFAEVLPCSCGGISARLSWKSQIWINLFLTLLAGFGILINQYIKPTL
jgi:hypothetical protein